MKNFTNNTDEELIQMYLLGNVSAFSELITKHKNKIYTSIYLLLKDKYLAEDIFQDVFVKVIDALTAGRYNEEGKFLPWVMRIAHNMCVDHFRKIKSSPSIKTSDNFDIFEVLNFSENTTEEKISRREKVDKIRTLIDKLPEEQRETLILRHYAELSFKEIAALTNCSINTALGRMRYGLLGIRKMIAENSIAL
jgi:RNA polymerase sigma-70 factor (ECF subfamily)